MKKKVKKIKQVKTEESYLVIKTKNRLFSKFWKNGRELQNNNG